MAKEIPEMALSSGQKGIPAVGLGTAAYPPVPSEAMQSAFFEAIAEGFRHFDTASLYRTESPLGEAIAEAIRRGLVGSRDELFITTKLWATDTHPGSVVPALRESLRELQLDYVNLYLVHWPLSLKPSKVKFPFLAEDVLPMDMKSVWEEMEECQKLGLAKSIGVSNFSCKKLDQILATAKIPPAVNQVEMHPLWQQRKLTDFCKEKGIVVSAYSPLGASGAPWGTIKVMECRELKEIAAARGKSIAQAPRAFEKEKLLRKSKDMKNCLQLEHKYRETLAFKKIDLVWVKLKEKKASAGSIDKLGPSADDLIPLIVDP